MPDISNQLSSEVKELKGVVRELADVLQSTVSTMRDAQDEAADTLSKKKKNNDDEAKVDADGLAIKEKYQEAYEDFSKKSRAERRKELREQIKQHKDDLKHYQNILKNREALGKISKEEARELRKQINLEKEKTKLKESYLDELNSFNKAVEGVSTQIAKFQSGTLGKLFSGFFGKLTAVLGGATLGAAVLNVLNQSDRAFVNIAKAAGTSVAASGSMRKEFIAASGALQQMGLDTEQQAGIVGDIVNTYGKLSHVTQQNLEFTGSLMAGLGMSSEEAVSTLKVMTNTLGMSATNAQEFANTMKNEATRAGVSASLVFRDVTSYSERTNAALLMAPDRLKQAAIRARQLGTSLDETASVAENFDDLESSLGLAQEGAVLFGVSFDAMEMTRLARQRDNVGLQDKVLQSLKGQINAKGEIETTDIAQIKFLERVLGKDYPAVIKAFTLQNKLREMGVEDTKEMSAIEQLMLRDKKDLTNIDAKYLSSIKKEVKTKVKALEAEEKIADLAAKNQAIFEKIGNTFRSALVPLSHNVLDAFIEIFGNGEGIDEALAGFKSTLEGIIPSKDALVEGFKTIKTVVEVISSMLKFVFENPKLTILGSLATMLVGGAVKNKLGLGKNDGSSPLSALYVKMTDGASSMLDSLTDLGGGGGGDDDTDGRKNKKGKKFKGPTGPKNVGKGAKIVGSVMGLLRGAGPKMLTGLKKIFTGAIGKGFLKKIPVLGLFYALYDMVDRFKKGDYLGAGIEFISAVASLFPGIGTGISVALSGINVARDMAGGGKNVVKEGMDAAKNGAIGADVKTPPPMPSSASAPTPSSAPAPTPSSAPVTTPSKPRSGRRGRRSGGGSPIARAAASSASAIPTSVSAMDVEGMSAADLAAQYGIDISQGGYGFSQKEIENMSPQKLKDYLQKNGIEHVDKMSKKQQLKMFAAAKSGKFRVDEFQDGGKIPRGGYSVNKPTVALIGETNEEEIILPTERLRKGLPVDPAVAAELASIGVPGFFRGGKVGVDGGAAGTGLGGKSDLGASLGDAQAATAFATAAGDLTEKEKRLAVSINDTTAAQLEMQNIQDNLNQQRLNDQKKFDLSFLEAVGKHMVSAETFINNNAALMDRMGGVGDFLQNNAQLIGDVGRFLQAKDKKEAAITLALDTLQNKIKSSFGEKGVIANEIIDGLRSGMKPSQAAMKAFGNSLLSDKKAREQKQKEFLAAQDKQLQLEEYFRQQGITDQGEIQEKVSQELDANTKALLAQGDPSSGGGPSVGQQMKESVGEFAVGTQALMASGMSFKDAAKQQLKNQLKQFAMQKAWDMVKMAFDTKKMAAENGADVAKNAASIGPAIASMWAAIVAFAGMLWGVITAFVSGLIAALTPVIIALAPFILIAVIIVALIAALYLLIKFFPEIKKALSKAFKFIGKIVVTIVKTLFNAIKVFTTTIPKAILKAVFKLIKAVAGIFGKIAGSILKGFKKLIGKLNPLNWFSEGGVVTKPTMSMIGETGEKEVVVPVDRIKNGGKVKPEVMSELKSIAPNIVGSGGGSGGAGGGDGGGNDALISEIKMLRQEIAALSNRPIAVTLDGRQVAKSVGERFTDMSNNI